MSQVAFYNELIITHQDQKNRFAKTCNIISWIRLFLFVAFIISIYFILTSSHILFWSILGGFLLILFLILLKIHARFLQKRDYAAQMLSLCEKELQCLNFNFLDFEDGKEYQDPEHAFASDIDLFGEGSAFQYINRTITLGGRNLLAGLFLAPLKSKEDILLRQETCREIAENAHWRLDFAASGSLKIDPGFDANRMNEWLKFEKRFKNLKTWTVSIRIVQVAMLLLILLACFKIVDYMLPVTLAIVNLIFLSFYLKQINKTQKFLSRVSQSLQAYSELFGKIATAPFQSKWFKLQAEKINSQGNSAALRTQELSSLLQKFDARNNLLIGFSRNALFLTDLLLVVKMEQWRNENGTNIKSWFDALANIDEMNSIANFAFNNPEFCFPKPSNKEFIYHSVDLGHPLIPKNKRICNDFEITNWHKLTILTGANMAGKSTFLRTIGINHTLACIGAPVCASAMEFTPCQLMTCIRANDSLIKNESYFYAELLKLKRIVEALKNGTEIFILLDEVLKGTNSHDKLEGSIILAKQLIQFRTSGIIATHDIALGELEKLFPSNIANACFEAEIDGSSLSFDYKIRNGMAKNMTAMHLMKQLGII
jgi:hypothetical protein